MLCTAEEENQERTWLQEGRKQRRQGYTIWRKGERWGCPFKREPDVLSLLAALLDPNGRCAG